jgi:hypothetical protein
MYSNKKSHISLAKSILLSSAKGQQTEDTIPADKRENASGFETLRDGRFILQT